ncbi:hypothetical protein A6U89_32815 [Agrobacterium sp. B133/95]|nr:hypothetical protein A6U89_32815 [Agrobacterium sp. B133/95]
MNEAKSRMGGDRQAILLTENQLPSIETVTLQNKPAIFRLIRKGRRLLAEPGSNLVRTRTHRGIPTVTAVL